MNISPISPPLGASARERARAIAVIARRHADDVDRAARFPVEAFAALKDARMLGWMVPPSLGGEGVGLGEVAAVIQTLAAGCGSTGLVYAMHQAQLAALIAHAGDSPWHRRLLERVAAEQLLIASATTERATGGDIRASVAAVELQAGRFTLDKDATVLSYGEDADVILATARRSPRAPSSDQVLVALTRDQFDLELTTGWDALGMRGTRSLGYRLRGEGDGAQILPQPYAEISAATVLPVAHIAWSAVWLGIAGDALDRARAFHRARATPGASGGGGASRLAAATTSFIQLRASVRQGLGDYQAMRETPDGAGGPALAVAFNALKVAAAETAVTVVAGALAAIGLAGYRNDGPSSLSRHLRDVLSAPLMIGNDRILDHIAGLLPIHRETWELFERP